ncbi:Diaminopimelate epimerase-like protein [Exidia glandulosa HHB12029]|uniref:Diaminopimelate epimerase-like protein n=1 Tax=Exidia glandulosa HHB12029 TaxID=1314781 RepID=A0A165D490_EXIGL|nr:Diaminopimelate epimerase-like protein [Exidia glandulosa HHB12029]
MSKQLPYTIVDAFTTQVFLGNPAAVLVLEHPLSNEEMQFIAREFNLSDTAFISPTSEPTVFDMIWYTPGREVSMCGHASVASAYVLDLPHVTFKTRLGAGDVSARKAPDGTVSIEFPAGDPISLGEETKARVAETLRRACKLDAVPKINFVGEPADPFKGYLLIHVDDDLDIASLHVDSGCLAAELPDHFLQIITNAPPAHLKEQGKQFVSRVFAGAAGVIEDPVCGSAHCILTPYWTKVLGQEGRELAAKQVSARSGDLWVEWNTAKSRVTIKGKAVTAATGVLNVPKLTSS